MNVDHPETAPHDKRSQDDPAESEDGEGGDEPVIVIGSGFGGAVTACRLAEAGFRVLMLERGRRYDQDDYPNLPNLTSSGAAPSFLPDTRRWAWTVDQGLWDVLDLKEIVAVQAAGFGGGSLIYANVHLRPPAMVFDGNWPAQDKDRVGLDPYFDLAGSMLEVAPVSAHPAFRQQIIKSDQLARAADATGRKVFYPPLAIRYESGANAYGQEQNECTGCGACCTGCPQRAKNTLNLNYLALAEKHGARVLTQWEVLDLVEEASGRWAVRCFDHLEARTRTLRAKNVFLCAGAVHTTRLMAGARLLKGQDAACQELKAWVGMGYFPGGDAIGIAYETTHRQAPTVGPVISTAFTQMSDRDPSSFFMIQDGGYPRAIDRLVGTLRASAWLDRNREPSPQAASVPATPTRPSREPSLPPFGKPLTPQTENRRVSPLDDLVRAQQTGAFNAAVPHQLRCARKYTAKLLSRPLILAAVVAQTIVGGFRDRLSRRCIKRLVPRCIRSALVRFGVRVARATLGTDEQLGVRALVALSKGGDLLPEVLAATILGYDGEADERRAVLLAMGRDAAMGSLHYNRRTREITADLDFGKLTPGYAQQEIVMRQLATKLGGELRTNPVWEFLGKPISVHNQGGCRMSDDPTKGVTDPYGKVHGREGLYILDGSLVCRSVGVNPSATIAALAERGVLQFIRAQKPSWPVGYDTEGAREYEKHQARAREWAATAKEKGWDLEPPLQEAPPGANPPSEPRNVVGLTFTERMSGYFYETTELPPDEAGYLALENRGRPAWPADLRLELGTDDLAAFYDDDCHRMKISGRLDIRLPGRAESSKFDIKGGTMDLFVAPTKPYAIPRWNQRRLQAHLIATGFKYRGVRPGGSRTPQRRLVRYSFSFEDSGTTWLLEGYKLIAPTSTIEAWRQTSILYFILSTQDPSKGNKILKAAGAVHVDLTTFLFTEIPSIAATGSADKARQVWAVTGFAEYFFGTLQRIYLPALRAAAQRSMTRRRLAQDKS